MVTRNANEAMVEPGGVCVWQESGVRRSVLCWCVWQESGFSRHEEIFTFNLLLKRCYKCCAFSAICKAIVAINCITFQHDKGSFP
jgi:hypothetical protein